MGLPERPEIASVIDATSGSGRALIRLSHVHRANPDDEDINRERSQSVALAGTPHGRALAEQEIQIVPDFGGFLVFAPVTSRGEAVGGIRRQNVIIQIETAVVYDRLFSNQVEMISGHAMRMRHTARRSE